MRRTAEDALKQAFMSREDYESLPVGVKVWDRLARPVLLWGTIVLGVPIVIAGSIMIAIAFELGRWQSRCSRRRLSPLPPKALVARASDPSYLLTPEEARDYFWWVVFVPTALLFSVTVIYLAAGILVAYTAPKRTPLIKVVENNCCASKRGGVRCLFTLELIFMVMFILMALFLGSSIVTLDTGCSLLLFWCYEVVCWGVVFLLGMAAFFLHRKAALVMDQGEQFGSRTVGMEMLVADPLPPSQMERRVNEGFRRWMGSSSVLSSSEDEDEGEKFGLDDDVWEDDPAMHVVGSTKQSAAV